MPRVLNAMQVDFAIESWAEDVVSHVSCVVCDFHHCCMCSCSSVKGEVKCQKCHGEISK